MCGIVGILGHEPVTAPLIDPLKREDRREVRLGYGIIAPHDRVFEKTVSNMQEVVARQGKIILITDPQGAHDVHMGSLSTLTLPAMPATVTPLVYAIPVQLIAYHTAVVMGTHVDRPRNLAKSVTVE